MIKNAAKKDKHQIFPWNFLMLVLIFLAFRLVFRPANMFVQFDI